MRRRSFEYFLLFFLVVYCWNKSSGDIYLTSIIPLSIRSFYFLIRDFGIQIPIFRFLLTLNYIQIALTPLQYYFYDLDFSSIGTRFSMNLPESDYFPYVISYLLFMELAFSLVKSSNNKLDRTYTIIRENTDNYVSLGYKLITVGIIASVIHPFIPSSLQFISLLLSNLYIVGALVIYNTDYKKANMLLGIIVLWLIITTLREGLFINMFIWLTFIAHYVNKKYPINLLKKISAVITLSLLVLILNISKHQYRKEVWLGNIDRSAFRFIELMYEASQDKNVFESGLTALSVRLNQGFLLSQIMDQKNNDTITYTYLNQELIGVLLPRFIYKNKLTVNSAEKVSSYTNLPINRGVALSVGIHGDGYANFGFYGGLIFSFLFYVIMFQLYKFLCYRSVGSPILVFFVPYIYFYLVRPGSEFYIVTNWIVKSCILIALLVLVFPKWFRHDEIIS